MSNFMGPMAPPPAAPAQPQALDFQTDPNQRQRFKQFMRQRMQSPMPQMPAPMPQPMPTVPAGSYIFPDMDIFAPQQFYDGGIVGGLNNLGEMSGQMVEALNQVVYGGDPMGGGASNGGFGGGNTPPPLPPIQSSAPLNNFGGSFSNSLFGSLMPYGNVPTARVSGPMSGGNVGGDNLMGVLPNGGVTSGQMPPGFTPLPPGELGFTENMMGPIQGYAGGSATFDESAPYQFADGGSVPPRETDIRGQYHELSYITPDEADILMALGGSGEPGPMGIPQYGYGDDDGSEGYGDGDSDTGGMGSGSDPGGGGRDNDDRGWSDNDYRGYQEEDEQQQTKDMQDYEENVFGGDSPDGYSVQDILNANAGISETLGDVYDMNAINRGRQDRMNLQETLDNTLENEIETGKVSTGTAVNDGDIESLDALTNAVESSSKIGGTNTGNNLLGGIDDLLGSLDKAISKVSGPTQSEIQAGTFTPTVVGSSDPETYDPDLDQATKNALSNIGVDQSVIDKISRGSSQSGLESEGILGSLGIGSGAAYKGSVNNRFGTATGPGRLSTVTAEEMEALRTGNAVQRQMYRQLAGIKSAGPVLSSFDPNNVKDPNILDSIFGVTNKPSSAIEVFRAPITEQQGFKSVNTGTFKDGIAGVTGMGNTPGVIGGIMQMFGIDPIVYTGDNRFDPNRPSEDFGGGGDDNILLPLKPEEVAPESTDPNRIGGIGTGGSPLAPAGPVVVPSNRTSAPFSGQMPVGYGTPQTGQINPYSLSEMQRYQQMLARLGQAKSPIGFADGGSVLDAAAGRFLESLTAA